MSNEKPSRNEDEYFAREDAERLARLRAKEQAEHQAVERRRHHMKCPKCGADLHSETFHGIQVDRCPECHGIWLDNGELALLMKHDDPGAISRVMSDLWSTLRRKQAGS